jgi:hypothetical protein
MSSKVVPRDFEPLRPRATLTLSCGNGDMGMGANHWSNGWVLMARRPTATGPLRPEKLLVMV